MTGKARPRRPLTFAMVCARCGNQIMDKYQGMPTRGWETEYEAIFWCSSCGHMAFEHRTDAKGGTKPEGDKDA
jgi:ribosomal protein L37E